MTDRIDSNVNIQHTTFQNPTQAAALEGHFKGDRAAQKMDAASLVADAAEELSFSTSESVEKKLAKRKIATRSGKKTDALERAEFYLKQLSDIGGAEKMNQFMEHLKKKGKMPHDQLLKETGKFFKDTAHQYAALKLAKQKLEKEGDSGGLADSIQGAMDVLMDTHGPELEEKREATGLSQEDFESVHSLKSYFLQQIFEFLLDKYGEKDFATGINDYIKTEGESLQSRGSDISTAELKDFIDELYKLEALGNLYRDCEGLQEKLKTHFNVAAAK